MRAVIFDVDDTLYLERDYVRSGFAAVGEHLQRSLGVEGFFDTAWRLFEEGLRGRVFDAALDSLGVANASISELVEVYRWHQPGIRLLNDSASVLERLVAGAIPIGVITDGPVASQWAKIAALGLEKFATVVVVTGELGEGRGKPHEAAFKLVEEELAMGGDELTYVADNPAKDFIAPYRRGWRTVRIRRSGALHQHQSSGPDVGSEYLDLASVVLA